MAKHLSGSLYKYGGQVTRFDCLGFTSYLLKQFDSICYILPPHNTSDHVYTNLIPYVKATWFILKVIDAAASVAGIVVSDSLKNGAFDFYTLLPAAASLSATVVEPYYNNRLVGASRVLTILILR
ncbi:MAG: hypothetical protein H6543_00350 [Prevotellaceae bacterium]|nr:hypothetical protein [Prevotellaceae bacterium]